MQVNGLEIFVNPMDALNKYEKILLSKSIQNKKSIKQIKELISEQQLKFIVRQNLGENGQQDFIKILLAERTTFYKNFQNLTGV